MWNADGKGNYGLLAVVANEVWKNKGGKLQGDPPSSESMQEFFAKIDADKDWFPGKQSNENKRVPKRVLTGVKVTAIVSSARKIKAVGADPT